MWWSDANHTNQILVDKALFFKSGKFTFSKLQIQNENKDKDGFKNERHECHFMFSFHKKSIKNVCKLGFTCILKLAEYKIFICFISIHFNTFSFTSKISYLNILTKLSPSLIISSPA